MLLPLCRLSDTKFQHCNLYITAENCQQTVLQSHTTRTTMLNGYQRHRSIVKGSRSTLRHTNLLNSQIGKSEVSSLRSRVTHLSSDQLMTAYDPIPTTSTSHVWCTRRENPQKFASIVGACELSRREMTFCVSKIVHRWLRKLDNEPCKGPNACPGWCQKGHLDIKKILHKLFIITQAENWLNLVHYTVISDAETYMDNVLLHPASPRRIQTHSYAGKQTI